MVLQTVALYAHGERDKAAQLLGDALALAKPGGIIRVFVDEGSPMAELLSEAAAQGIMPGYADKLVAAFEAEEQPVLAGRQASPGKSKGESYLPPAPPAQPLGEPLSQRELQVLQLIAGGDAIYFTLFPGLMVSYPAWWAVPLAVLVGLLLLGIAVLGVRSGQLTYVGALKGVGAFLLSVVASSGLATGIWMGATQLHGEYQAMLTFRGMVYNARFYLFAFVALAVAVAAAILVLFRQKTAVMDLSFGALFFLWLVALVTSILLPGFSYLVTWPLLFSALATGWVLWRSARGGVASQPEIVLTVGALPGVILFAPSIYVMFHFALAPMIGVLAFMVALLLGLLIPQLDLLTRTRQWPLSAAALVICVAFLIVGSLTAGFDTDHPRPNAVAYLLDADSMGLWWSGPCAWIELTLTPKYPAIRWVNIVAALLSIVFNLAGLPYKGAYDDSLVVVSLGSKALVVWYA